MSTALTEAEICREAGLQSAKAHKWQGWDWKAYQVSITRQNHHISKLEAHAGKLADALRRAISDDTKAHGAVRVNGRYGQGNNDWRDQAQDALAAWEA